MAVATKYLRDAPISISLIFEELREGSGRLSSIPRDPIRTILGVTGNIASPLRQIVAADTQFAVCQNWTGAYTFG